MTDFKSGVGLAIKAQNDWPNVGWLKLPFLLVTYFNPDGMTTYLIEVNDSDEAMSVQMAIHAVVDCCQVHHQCMSFASFSVEIFDGPQLDKRRGVVLGQGPTCV